jgi:phenylacetate-coenzyme A ligase PaaK-like adenylate-forming protein
VSAASRAGLEAEILGWMHEQPWRHDEARFERLARALFALQVASCPPYARFCEEAGMTPESVSSWREIPAVPTGAFKELRLACFAPSQTHKIFRTSGTSSGRRGELHLDRLDLY